jgi:hypothetical protein
MTFVSANRRLRRIGRQRCLLIPRLRPGQRASFVTLTCGAFGLTGARAAAAWQKWRRAAQEATTSRGSRGVIGRSAVRV